MDVRPTAERSQNGDDAAHGLSDQSGRSIQVFIDNADQIIQTLNERVEWSIREAGPSNQHVIYRCGNASGNWTPESPISTRAGQEDDAFYRSRQRASQSVVTVQMIRDA